MSQIPHQTGDGRLKKPAKTREELEAWKTSANGQRAWPFPPHEDTWKVLIMTEGPQDAGRSEIADRLRTQFDLKG